MVALGQNQDDQDTGKNMMASYSFSSFFFIACFKHLLFCLCLTFTGGENNSDTMGKGEQLFSYLSPFPIVSRLMRVALYAPLSSLQCFSMFCLERPCAHARERGKSY